MIDKFLQERIIPEPNSGCFLWLGSTKYGGYGQIIRDGKNYQVHRYIWQLNNGQIPEGLFVCHRCDNRICCNIDHLFLGTPKDNTDDMHRKGRWKARGIGKKPRKSKRALVAKITRRLRKTDRPALGALNWVAARI